MVERAVPFGYKMAWLAVRSTDPAAVIAGLDVRGADASSWKDGIDAVYSSGSLSEHPVFVTPALDGWVLVVSPAYFDEATDAEPERLGVFVGEAAARLGTEVQLFATHRVVEGHAWARSYGDGSDRAFFYLGEIDECLLDLGVKTPHEATMECFDETSDAVPDESAVMSVARSWSLDPTELDERFPDAADGYLGMISASAEPEGEADPSAILRRPWWKFW